MAGLEGLTSSIYHERQQPGSMLCAQHALNSLLQGNYFTAPDLATIAHELDALEQGTLDAHSRHTTSMNMDDTGFFSVQVMEHALKNWGLNLTRWRSAQMRPFQESPYTQLAFVLNLQQHWFTLRRFGPAESDVGRDPGLGHWYNLNSSLPSPEWIGRTYLGMVLQQAEDEGYSVFAVCQADPSAPLALPRVDEDYIATTLEAPDAEQHLLNTSDPSAGTTPAPPRTAEPTLMTAQALEMAGGDDDDDMALQAALQASLTGGEFNADAFDAFGGGDMTTGSSYRPPVRAHAPALRQAPQPPPTLTSTAPGTFTSEHDLDPVAASLARNRAMLSRMRAEQEEALRGSYEAEVEERFAGPGVRPGTGTGATGLLRRRTSGEIDEDEQVRRAIAESLEEDGEGVGTGDPMSEDEDDREYIDVDAEEDDEGDKENSRSSSRRRQPPTTRNSTGRAVPDPGTGTGLQPAPQHAIPDHRVYDDEDEELQAALRASLETMPAGYVPPPSPRPQAVSRTSVGESGSARTSGSGTAVATPAVVAAIPSSQDGYEDMDDEGGPSERFTSPPPVEEKLDVDEMRRRRLAKFGG